MTAAQEYDTRWIRRFGAAPAGRPRLVCFPHAGGAASYYFAYSRALAPEVDVLAVQYPGRQERRLEPLLDNVAALADAIAAALPRPDGVPFAFFGHSMGAVLAFEVTRRLQQDGRTLPEHVFVSGRRAPSRWRPGAVHLKDDAGLVAEMRAVGGTDPRFFEDQELVAAALTATRNDYKAIERYEYHPGEPLTCPVTALVGDCDPQATVEDAEAWREHTAARFALRVFPGGHFYLDAQRAEVVSTILTTLGAGRLMP
ncbi:thioesterase II family protein [Dactylosporangium sp. NPDC051541]|uniref:thioesterase II family protein n=1 Tax=Dactylosporangium sp. NPDC051541 TaxID=3363977 RepID=UPI0037B10BEE